MSNNEVITTDINRTDPLLSAEARIAFVGHRCLQHYDMTGNMEDTYNAHPEAVWISNGSIGTGLQVAGFAQKHDIPLIIVLPFPSKFMTERVSKEGKVTAKWSDENKEDLVMAVKYAKRASILSPIFSLNGYQRANERMVDMSTMLVSMIDPTNLSNAMAKRGRALKCTEYALKHTVVDIIDIRPEIETVGTGEFIRYSAGHGKKVVRILGNRTSMEVPC